MCDTVTSEIHQDQFLDTVSANVFDDDDEDAAQEEDEQSNGMDST
jgi:hypothetical protein